MQRKSDYDDLWGHQYGHKIQEFHNYGPIVEKQDFSQKTLFRLKCSNMD